MKFFPFNRVALPAILMSLAVLIFACQKEGNNAPSEPTVNEEEAATYSTESMEVEGSYDDVQDIAMIAGEDEGLASAARMDGTAGRLFPFAHLRKRIGDCAVITVTPDDSTYPKTVIIDFGTDGCRGLDGKFRKGKMVLQFSGPIRKSGSVLTITLVDFHLNRASVEGTKTITNLSEGGNTKFTVRVINGKVSWPNGRGYLFERVKNVKQIEGGNTDDIEDDVYSIEGRSQTTFNNGIVTSLNTVDALIKKTSCDWITNGTLKIKVNNRELFLDYGYPNNGDCDNQALLTWHNNTRQAIILLP
jgi:hypothetical protein